MPFFVLRKGAQTAVATTVRWQDYTAGGVVGLSLSNRRALALTGGGSPNEYAVRAGTSVSSGKHFFQVFHSDYLANAVKVGFDIGGDDPLSSNAVWDAFYVIMSAPVPAANAESVTVDTTGTTPTGYSGVGICFALDLDAGKGWLGHINPEDADITWRNGDPATGTDPQYSSLPAGDYYLFGTVQGNSGSVRSGIVIPEYIRGTVPSGFSVA